MCLHSPPPTLTLQVFPHSSELTIRLIKNSNIITLLSTVVLHWLQGQIEVKIYKDSPSRLLPTSSNIPASSIPTLHLFSKPQSYTRVYSGAFRASVPCTTTSAALLLSVLELPLLEALWFPRHPEVELNMSVYLSHFIALLVNVSSSSIWPKPFEERLLLPDTIFPS